MFLMVLSFVIAPVALVCGQPTSSVGAIVTVVKSVNGVKVGVANAQITVFDGKTGVQLAQGMTDATGAYWPYVYPQCTTLAGGTGNCIGYSLHVHINPPAGTQLAAGYVADQFVSDSGNDALFNWLLTTAPACTASNHVLFPSRTCCSGSYHIKQNGGPFGGSEEICN
jgi:hypothetical protein